MDHFEEAARCAAIHASGPLPRGKLKPWKAPLSIHMEKALGTTLLLNSEMKQRNGKKIKNNNNKSTE